MPPEITNGLITLGLTSLTVLGGIVVALGLYLRSYMQSQTKKNKALVEEKIKEVETQRELKEAASRIELNKIQIESSNNAEAVKLAIEVARTTTSRLDKAEALTESLEKQLQESRASSKENAQKIGELQALLSKTASERDQERIQREALETQRNEAIAQVEAMKAKIAELESKAAQLDKLTERVAYLEERHKANNELQVQIIEAEQAKAVAQQELVAVKAELAVERRKSQQFATPVEPTADRPAPEATTL